MPRPTRSPGVRRQRGVSLLFALLTLVVMLLSTLALVRSVDSGTMVLGNIGFKQDATAAADQATRQAAGWLSANAASLNIDVVDKGYYASNKQFAADGTALGPLDVTGRQAAGTATRQLVNWDADECLYAPTGSFSTCTIGAQSAGTINGNTASYVIFRLCSKAGNFASDGSIVCSKPVTSTSGGATKRGELNYIETTRLAGVAGPYYRIVVRVKGARDTVSFTETIVHF